MLRTIIAAVEQNEFLTIKLGIESMLEDRQHMTMEELVDILAQKTQKFTQLLVYKNFESQYEECKEAIQQILAEIELRKENMNQNTDAIRSQFNSTIQ